MKFHYTQHALDRLAERQISKRQIEYALRQGTPQQSHGRVYTKTVEVDGQMVEVVYQRDRQKPGTYIIITVYEPKP